MIPKIIHYCWFGKSPLSDLALKCIESWKKYFPDYQIIEWNETNFNININNYVREAYEAKKFAFVSDYARFYILYNYGGVYFDVDVEVVKNMDEILLSGPYMGCQKESDLSSSSDKAYDLLINPGLGFAAYPKMFFLKEMLDFYNGIYFKNSNGTLNLETIVTYTTSHLQKYGLINTDCVQKIADFNIYPKEYFNPREANGRIVIRKNTYTIHHFDASWQSPYLKMKIKLVQLVLLCFGTNNLKRILSILHLR